MLFKRRARGAARKYVSVLLSIMLVIPMALMPATPAAADYPNDDSAWPSSSNDIVPGGVWTRESLAANIDRYRDWGINENFVWYSREGTVSVQADDPRLWASRNWMTSGSFLKNGLWLTRISDIFNAGAPIRVWMTSETSYVAKVCGNHSEWITPPAPPRIVGRLYEDLNGNGIHEFGEPGKPGWKMNFFRGGALIGSVLTDGSGSYEFSIDACKGRLPGLWTIAPEVQPGWIPTASPARSINVVAGHESASRRYGGNDFMNFALGSISGAKFNDLNGDGVQQDDEPGLACRILLSREGMPFGAAVSDPVSGAYRFDGLPAGTYSVTEAVLPGWKQTAPLSGAHFVSITSGTNAVGRDFGNVQDGSITPFKVHDLNMDGVAGADEPLLAGWIMHLGADIRPPLTTTSSLADTPRWEALPTGTYQVSEEPQAGFADTSASSQSVVLGPGQHVTVPFLGIRLGRIDVVKYHDLDGNGSRVDEPGIAGWKITLVKDGTAFASATTDEDGAVSFTDLVPGDYLVQEETRPPYWVSTTDESSEVHLGPGQDVDIAFGNRQLGAVEGVVYTDSDGDGTHDAAEPGLAGVEVRLYRADGTSVGLPAVSDSSGVYRFDSVIPGEYKVSEQLPDRHMPSSPTSGTVAVGGGNVSEGPRFLVVEGVSVSGVMYDDSNANGSRSADESPLIGWGVNLERLTAHGWVSAGTTISQADGTYSFEMLWPGEYRLSEDLQAHWKMTDSGDSTGWLASGAHAGACDMGNIRLAQLTLYKWDDSNSNGRWDEGEQALPGYEFKVTGTCVDSSSYASTAQTDESGMALLSDLMPGEYVAQDQFVACCIAADGAVEEPGWRPTTSETLSVSLSEGASQQASFGDIHLGWIWGRVTHELYGTGIPGVRVELEETGQTAFTNSNGYYFFYEVEPNRTQACPTADYLVGMDLSGTGLTTRGAVDKSVVVAEGGAGRADFTIFEDLSISKPRTIGYWKNWQNHYTAEQMQVMVDRIRLGSDEFASLSVADIAGIIQVDRNTTPRAKARAQYLACWLNIASSGLGLSTHVDVSTISGWQQVATSASSEGITMLIDLVHDAEQAFAQELAPAVWETVKSIFDKLNNGLLG